MMKVMLALGTAAVALTATPSDARRHYTNATTCAKWRHGQCVKWKRLTRHQAYRMGYRFGG